MHINNYDLPPSKKEIVARLFINFSSFNIIKSVKHSPDKRFTLLNIDGKQYALEETDYFNNEDNYESNEIANSLGVSVTKWLKPKIDDENNYDNISIKINDTVYGLAIVK